MQGDPSRHGVVCGGRIASVAQRDRDLPEGRGEGVPERGRGERRERAVVEDADVLLEDQAASRRGQCAGRILVLEVPQLEQHVASRAR